MSQAGPQDREDIAAVISLLAERGVSDGQIAAHMGVARATVFRWRHGSHTARSRYAIKRALLELLTEAGGNQRAVV